jgi:hypothetical protein
MGQVERYRASIDPRDVLDIPAEIKPLFDKTPLLSHEDPQPYWACFRRLIQEVKPSDTIEWLWLKDIADQSWEIIALRRIKAAISDAGKRAAVVEMLGPVGEAAPQDMIIRNAWDQARERADKCFDSKSEKEIESRLTKQGLNADSVSAVSFSRQVGVFEAVERMLAALEFRRNNALREIEQRRERLGRLIRQESDNIIDGELSSVAPR